MKKNGECATIVGLNEDILIAALLEAENPVDWHVREGVPVPDEQTWREMITRVQILMSMLKNTKGYLGDFDHVLVQHRLGSEYLFPAGIQKVLCIVAKPRAHDQLVVTIKNFMRG